MTELSYHPAPRYRATGVAGTAIVIIPAGSGLVAGDSLTAIYALVSSGGTETGGLVTVSAGAAVEIFDDGVDVCQLQVSAAGEVTVQRTAGAETFDVILQMVWL